MTLSKCNSIRITKRELKMKRREAQKHNVSEKDLVNSVKSNFLNKFYSHFIGHIHMVSRC